jgi:hypothetical protein
VSLEKGFEDEKGESLTQLPNNPPHPRSLKFKTKSFLGASSKTKQNKQKQKQQKVKNKVREDYLAKQVKVRRNLMERGAPSVRHTGGRSKEAQNGRPCPGCVYIF